MNNYGCAPSPAHPRPIVLINGALLNKYANWAMLSPLLTAQGYCVFGLDYGGSSPGPFHQTGNLRDAAAEIGQFVQGVLQSTGASQVDLVGYSEGGMVALYYLNVLGGDSQVNTKVALDSPVRG
ncbi:alpha/beta fold hydrolase [Nocardia sp. NPDC004860]|uniref:esterase/lipase family protein n=1 Tax=Nocardia sp. NPDC004860 TaxID=3154557 RepID=UPI0033AC6E9B